MKINFIVYNQDNQPVGMDVEEIINENEVNEDEVNKGKVAIAVVRQLIKMRLLSSITCKDENDNTIIEIM